MVCCLHTLLHLNVCLHADAIANRWAENGISGEASDVELVVHVLSGQRKFKLIVVTICILQNNLFLYFAGVWPKDHIKKVDVLRMMTTCDVMDLDITDSIYNIGCNVLQKRLHKYVVTHFSFSTYDN